MPRFELYQNPDEPPRRRGAHAVAWGVMCVLLQLSVLFWLWVVLTG
jgi:hypothetical protein